MLRDIQRIKPVWVELGLQTIHEETAKFINRGYPISVYDEAVKKLRDLGVHVIVHMILGLPGETQRDMIETAEYIGKSGAQGIKLQLFLNYIILFYQSASIICLLIKVFICLI